MFPATEIKQLDICEEAKNLIVFFLVSKSGQLWPATISQIDHWPPLGVAHTTSGSLNDLLL